MANDGLAPPGPAAGGSAAVSAVERVKAMSLEEVKALLAAAGREAVLVEGADGAPLLRRRRDKVSIGAPGGPRVLTLAQLLAALAAVPAALAAMFLLWWRPHLPALGASVVAGLLGGVLFSMLYAKNRRRKDQLKQLLSQDPGLKGCQYLLGCVPSWINLTDREKMEWLNKLLGEMWPYYDRGICRVVKETVEPIMETFRPPGIIKRIFFTEFTFGLAPFRIEGITVKESDDEIDMEVDVRWCGDANIALGIDLPIGGDLTRLNPKVTDIVFVATLKIILKPLVRKIPGFAAIAVALKSPPLINYRLNFGALSGGSITTAPIVGFVNYIVKEVLVGMLLWPKRFTVPILSSNGILPAGDPEIDLEVERLMGRVRGVIKVDVIRAKGLKSYDSVTGKSDPLVELFTTSNFRYETRHINNTLEPEWGDTFYLPVLEKDQILHVEVFDHDAVNLANIAQLQIWKGIADAVGAKEFMGRSAVPLAPFIAEEGLEEEMWFPLGRGEWTNPQGPGKGEGLIKLGLQYRPIESIAGAEVAGAKKGLLIVGVLGARKLASSKGDNLVSYAKVKVGKKDGVTPRTYRMRDPRWSTDNKFTFYDVTLADDILITVLEPALTMDDELGSFRVKMPDLVESKMVSRWTKQVQVGYLHKWVPLADGDGAQIEVELEFLPHW
ncbi:MAG: hypothetical protein J3K34DRAFT_456945 [Monoraphidium minutum]|nr:MAG: hypothetical protein J3K34DRAFT_456945 [Monoraphidium minutum]